MLLARDPILADEVLAGPLETITDDTVTDPERLRALLTETRRDAFAITPAERDDGGSGLTVPVFDHSGAVSAAPTVSGPRAAERHAGVHVVVDIDRGRHHGLRAGRRSSPA